MKQHMPEREIGKLVSVHFSTKNELTPISPHLDPQHEERIYQGWDSNTGTPMGPTQVIRHDPSHEYDEVLTMTAAPALNADGTPNGTEDISDLQSLTRYYTNDAGQVITEDDYFDLSNLAYMVGVMGVVGTNFYQRHYGYDDRGRLSTTTTGNGTIYQTVFDSLDRPLSDWVGTDASNLVQVRAYQYDNGGVGDGNLTQVTVSPGLGAADRVTQMWYDWRDRLVATKLGVQATENDGAHRPIIVTTYDNQDEANQTQQ